ncbi:sulfite exporter TauE/SafE family protein [Psychromonas sp. 14N.309.X.WAT.B.A12]|uniref:sulfite exporter TauE/SafE family protein n=1 Tax=unclassified Psychromonas TaxID=2614957 RepID=UPI0025AEE594|nr:sulfite exporter TauE/SafE family protein [Psychromonas sp. 14N.309.X.WAT.B.A12]MDN2663825.1 sulfite exporter TauE/SafE family protein [Psychromonas sp. 14N.309.X.WAT.B.A12]
MNDVSLWLLLAFIVASYVQSITGFAFGLIAMSIAGVFSLVPIEIAAFSVSVLSMVNAGTSLYGGVWRQVNAKNFLIFFIGSTPMIAVGVYLLTFFGENALHWLQLLLGVSIILACLMSLVKPKKDVKPSRSWVYFVFGGISGVFGGLFATSGPPISYLMYRQPIALSVIRATLLSVFFLSSLLRIVIMGVSNQITTPMVWCSLAGLPCVFIVAMLAKRYPPNISPQVIKRIALILLFLSGVSLSLKALL